MNDSTKIKLLLYFSMMMHAIGIGIPFAAGEGYILSVFFAVHGIITILYFSGNEYIVDLVDSTGWY